MSTKTTSKQKGQRKRSPNFPGVDLEQAISRARALYESSETHPVSLSGLAVIWEYAPKSSSFQKLIAALTAYGLVEIEGTGEKRQIKVSTVGERIIEDAPDAPQLIKVASVKPKLFETMWNKYRKSGIPKDATFHDHLRWNTEHEFNKDSIAKFAANFRRTIDYAKLTESDIIPPEGEGNGNDSGGNGQGSDGGARFQTPPPGEKPMKDWPIPLGGDAEAVLRLPKSMTKEMFAALKSVLGIYEGLMVNSDADEAGKETPED